MPDARPSADPSSLRTDQIVAATRALFVRYGYRRTSVDDIAREAGLAKATLYLHFAGKEEMFRAMILRFRALVNQRCDAAEKLDGPIEARVAALLYANYGSALEWFGDAAHLNELKMFASEYPIGPFDDSAPAFRYRLERMIEAAKTSGEIASGPAGASVQDIVQTLLFAAIGAKHGQRDGASGIKRALDTIVALIIGGLRRA